MEFDTYGLSTGHTDSLSLCYSCEWSSPSKASYNIMSS